MAIMILDPLIEQSVKERLEAANPDYHYEVWDGVIVVPPLANNEHNRIAFRLAAAFSDVIDWDRGDVAVTACNVSDRVEDWVQNYRDPDAIVVLAGGLAVDHDTHWVGGPDLVVEVISRGEDPRAKFDFYAAVGVREVLIVDRHPWAVELFRLTNGALASAGRSDLSNGIEVTSGVLPLAFRLVAGTPRPRVHVRHAADGRAWTA